MARWTGWSRRAVVLGTLALLVLGVGAVAPLAGALDPVTEGSDSRVVLGSGRAYVLHVPVLLRRAPRLAEGRPAMVSVHGLLSDPADEAKSTGFDALGDRDGVLVAYPGACGAPSTPACAAARRGARGSTTSRSSPRSSTTCGRAGPAASRSSASATAG